MGRQVIKSEWVPSFSLYAQLVYSPPGLVSTCEIWWSVVSIWGHSYCSLAMYSHNMPENGSRHLTLLPSVTPQKLLDKKSDPWFDGKCTHACTQTGTLSCGLSRGVNQPLHCRAFLVFWLIWHNHKQWATKPSSSPPHMERDKSARYSTQRYTGREIRMDSVIHFTHLPSVLLSAYLPTSFSVCISQSVFLSGVTVSEQAGFSTWEDTSSEVG